MPRAHELHSFNSKTNKSTDSVNHFGATLDSLKWSVPYAYEDVCR